MPITVDTLLAAVDLDQFRELFRVNAIDDDLLPSLTDADLKEIGIAQLGFRKRILEEIARHSGDEGAGLRAERCHLTVVFVDLVGSTEIAARVDPEEMRDLIREFHGLVARHVQRFEGHVAQLLGDGVLAYFGWPIRHENAAERAVRAGLAISHALPHLRTILPTPLQARIGIASGLVVVGGFDRFRTGDGPNPAIGDAPNLAARLQSLARPGGMVIAGVTRGLLGNMFVFTPMPLQQVKGFPQPVEAFEVAGERPIESRFAAMRGGAGNEMIGRRREMDLLLEGWQQVHGAGVRTILLRGEAGIGKSRIVEALVEETARRPRRILRHQCSPHHSDFALYPVITHISRAAGFAGGDRPADRVEKLLTFLRPALAGREAGLPHLMNLLGVDTGDFPLPLDETPQQRRSALVSALVALYDGLAGEGPALLIAEDLHWSDPTTLEFMALLGERLSCRSLLILATARPGAAPLPWEHSTIDVNRLDREATRQMVWSCIDATPLAETLLDEIVKTTDGIPLFVEEVTRSIVEQKLGGTNGSAGSGAALARLSVPATLQDTLMARLGRSADHKELAQTAAVIGRQFDYATLALLYHGPAPKMHRLLEDFEGMELVFRQGTPPDAAYAFKHALLRDAAHESLLKEDRSALHRKLLALLDHRPGVSPSIRAQHAEEAGLPDRALDYWEQSAAKALARSAYREAISNLANCIRLSKDQSGEAPSRRVCGYHLQTAQALLACEGYSAEATIASFERAAEAAERTGEAELQLPAMFGIWAGQHIAARPAGHIADRFLAIAQEKQLDGPLLVGHRIVGLERFYEGNFAGCHARVQEAYDGYDKARHSQLLETFSQDPRGAAGNYLVWVLWILGRTAEAQRVQAENLAWAREVKHPNTRSLILCYTGAIANIYMRRPDRVRDAAQKGLDLARGASHALWQAWAEIHLGWAECQDGRAAGLDRMEAGLDQALAAGAHRLEPLHRALLAECYAAAGQHPAAQSHIERAFEVMEATGARAFAAELHRIRATTLHRPAGDLPRAEADLRNAIAIARAQGALAFELRSAAELLRMGGTGNAADEARTGLARVVAAYDGEQITPDLAEARLLLGPLRA